MMKAYAAAGGAPGGEGVMPDMSGMNMPGAEGMNMPTTEEDNKGPEVEEVD